MLFLQSQTIKHKQALSGQWTEHSDNFTDTIYENKPIRSNEIYIITRHCRTRRNMLWRTSNLTTPTLRVHQCHIWFLKQTDQQNEHIKVNNTLQSIPL